MGPLAGAPVFTGASFGIAASLSSRNRCRPWPCARLSRAPTPTAAPPRPSPIGRRWTQPDRHAGRVGRAGPGRFPCSLRSARRRRSPALPLRHRHGSPAALHRGLPPDIHTPDQESPPTTTGTRRSRPVSTGFEPVSLEGTECCWFLAYSSPSRPPGPPHLAVLERPGFVGAAATLPGTSRVRLPPASPPRCDRVSGEGLSPHPNRQRLTAHVDPGQAEGPG